MYDAEQIENCSIKKLFTLVALVLLFTVGRAQSVGISAGSFTPDSSAMLHVNSTSKGMLVPRLTSAERDAITNPANGLVIYNRETSSFWFYIDGTGWKEILHSGITLSPQGPASGDLSGFYPNPIVTAIRNFPVSATAPQDKQILKWEETSFRWMPKNDSLFLPYDAAVSSTNPIFQITNNAGGLIGHVIVGRHSTGSGIIFGPTGVWGDHTTGTGVAGSSNSGNGVYGHSNTNYGVYGFSISSSGVYGTSNTTHGVLGQTALIGTAGVRGNNTGGGIGVWGDVGATGGYALYGSNSSTASSARAGYFQSSATANTGITLEAVNNGIGNAGFFNTTNAGSLQHTLRISNSGNGSAINVTSLNTGPTSPVVDVTNQGIGTGLNVLSTSNGKAAFFKNNFAGNAQTVVNVENNGDGKGLEVLLTKSTNTADAVLINNAGNGNGLNVTATGSTTGNLINVANNALGNAMNIITGTSAKNAVFKSTLASNPFSVITAEHNGLGIGVDINLTNAATNAPGISVVTAGFRAGHFISAGTSGILVNVNGNSSPKGVVSSITASAAANPIAIWGLSGANSNGGIGVLGEAGVTDPSGIGVKGISGGSNVAGIGVLGVGGPSNPKAIGVKGESYNQNIDEGAVTAVNLSLSGGTGLYAESQGLFSYGIVGTVGNTGNHSTAAKFANNYNNNTSPLTEFVSNGKGVGISVQNTNLSNNLPMLRMANAGTGEFVRLQDGLANIITTITKSGNITTDGTMTVKGDKGIIRNSAAAQLRVEVLTKSFPADTVAHYNEFNTPIVVNVTFGTAFSSPPSVYLGNVTSGSWKGLSPIIDDVTTTGCTIRFWNYTPYDLILFATIFKVIAIGPE